MAISVKSAVAETPVQQRNLDIMFDELVTLNTSLSEYVNRLEDIKNQLFGSDAQVLGEKSESSSDYKNGSRLKLLSNQIEIYRDNISDLGDLVRYLEKDL